MLASTLCVSLVSEPDSCLYISSEGGIRGKEYSDMRQFGIRDQKGSLLSVAEKRIHYAGKER